MRHFPLTLLAGLLACSLSAQEEQHVITDQASGLQCTLPKDWTFATTGKGTIAVNADKSAMVVLSITTQDFDQAELKVEKALGAGTLSDIKVDGVTMLADKERGAITALIKVDGSGVNENDEAVKFTAYIAKAGDKAGLALGAWKNPEAAPAVAEILGDIQVRYPLAASGTKLTDNDTGASVTIPAGWVAVASRKALLAYAPDRLAMILIIRPQQNFDEAVRAARTVLRERVFENVEIGAFSEVALSEASNKDDFTRIKGASGTAEDRVDHKPVEFRLLAVESSAKNEGTLVLGVWKNEKGQAVVEKLLASVHVDETKTKKAEKSDKDKDDKDGR